MKKIFIGCGVLVLLVLGFLGYVAYQFVPVVQEAIATAERMQQDFTALDQDYPFDETQVEALDIERFSSVLELRIELAQELELLNADFEKFGDDLEEKDLGIFDMGEFAGMLMSGMSRVQGLTGSVPSLLRQREMSATELSWHCRVMWATLNLIDAGAADEQLEPLRGEFDTFSREYELMRKENNDNEMPVLSEVIGEFDTKILEEAKAVFELDPQLVLDGRTEAMVEVFYLISTPTLQAFAEQDQSAVRVSVNGKDILGGPSNSDDTSTENEAQPSDG